MSKRNYWTLAAFAFLASASLCACGMLGSQPALTADDAQSVGDTVAAAATVVTGNPLLGYGIGAAITAALGIFAAAKAAKAKPATPPAA